MADENEERVESTHRRRPRPPHPEPSEVLPGPFEPGKVPDPVEAVCVQVEKIYDACSQKRCPEVVFDLTDKPDVQSVISCTTRDFKVKCDETQIQDDPPLLRMNIRYRYWVDVVYESVDNDEVTVSERVKHEKSVVLFGTEEMFCKVEAVLECLGCDIVSPSEIRCEIGEYLVIKSALDVQLLIPSYGFCPPPPECEELPTRCEEFFEAPPPPLYPPQPWDID